MSCLISLAADFMTLVYEVITLQQRYWVYGGDLCMDTVAWMISDGLCAGAPSLCEC